MRTARILCVIAAAFAAPIVVAQTETITIGKDHDTLEKLKKEIKLEQLTKDKDPTGLTYVPDNPHDAKLLEKYKKLIDPALESFKHKGDLTIVLPEETLQPSRLPVVPFDPRAMPADPRPMTADFLKALNSVVAKPTALLAALGSAGHQTYAADCGAAAAPIIAFRQKLGRPLSADDKVLLADGTLADLIAAYANACLATGEPAALPLPQAVQSRLANVTGVLADVRLDPPYICSATRIANDLVVTARHCVCPRRDDGTHELSIKNLYVYFLNEPNSGCEVIDAILPDIPSPTLFSRAEDVSDWVVLRIQAPSVPFAGITTGKPVEFQRLLIYGYQPLLELAERIALTSNKIPAATSWTTKLAADLSATCATSTLTGTDQCIPHGCQTEAGLSGAPIYVNDGTATLIGVHTRQVVPTEPATCDPTAPPKLPNVGVVLSAKARELAKGGQ